MNEILTYPHPALRQQAIYVSEVTESTYDDLRRMLALMLHNHGVGLAANQIGLSQRMFVALFNEQLVAFINPVIIGRDYPVVEENEACLSLPGISGTIKRFDNVLLEATGFDGKLHRYQLNGLPARIAQHEIDHLHGRLILDILQLQENHKTEFIQEW